MEDPGTKQTTRWRELTARAVLEATGQAGGSSRSRWEFYARIIRARMLRDKGLATTEIGRLIGRDHATISRCLRLYGQEARENPAFRAAALKARLIFLRLAASDHYRQNQETQETQETQENQMLTWEELMARANDGPAADRAGQPTRQRKGHREEELQKACIRWWQLQWGARTLNGQPVGDLLHHSPNGGRRDPAEGRKFKAMGTRPGFPDLILAIPSRSHPYLAIEMKTPDAGSEQSAAQRSYQRKIEAAGGLYAVARSLDEFRQIIDRYMGQTEVCGTDSPQQPR